MSWSEKVPYPLLSSPLRISKQRIRLMRRKENFRLRQINFQRVRNRRAARWTEVLKSCLSPTYSVGMLQQDWILRAIEKDMK